MCKCVARSMLGLLLLTLAQPSFAFVDPPVLVPPNPEVGQVVSVSVTAGVCDTFTSDPPTVTRTGNNIRINLASVSTIDPFCVFPTGAVVFAVGTFEAGSYTLQVDRTYLGRTGQVTETLGIIPFGVAAIPVIPALDTFGALLLIALLLAGSSMRIRGGLLLVLALASINSCPVSAQQLPSPNPRLEVLLSASSGSPTPDQVLAYLNSANRSGQTAPFAALTVENPVSGAYLLPVRAKGDFLAHLQAYPNSSRARMERYIVITYSQSANIKSAASALRSDSHVDAVFQSSTQGRFSSVQLSGFGVGGSPSPNAPVSSGPQYGRDDLNVDAAWQLAGGYALIGDINSGLYTAHAALTQFSPSGQYLGGNFVPASSLNIGSAGTSSSFPANWVDTNVDELWPPMSLPSNSVCNPNHLSTVPPFNAGHGTHVAGLIAANPTSSFGLKGTCLHCGIATWKISYDICSQFDGHVYQVANLSQVGAAMIALTDTGAQVINYSGGDTLPAGYCISYPLYSWCVGLTDATYRDITIVASAGNGRQPIQFPANDSRTLDAGGFQQDLTIWDLSPPPPNTSNCPPPSLTGETLGQECGSNYRVAQSDPPQELMASANQVLSTTYPQLNWAPFGCGDGFPGPGWGNGKGWCTGTSMSAPQISGVVGLLRSINPLVPSSVPVPNVGLGQPVGIRTVLARTTFEQQANGGSYFSGQYGFGHPDAAAAARAILGKVSGRQVINRVTPLFRLYSSGAGDYADTTSPQFATALMINAAASYQPSGSSIPGYASFPPPEPGEPALPAPKANVYVLTTEYRPWPSYPALIPLYLMDRGRNWPLGCSPGAGCNTNHRDFILVSTTADVQQAHTDGFSLRTIQGYIYTTCSPEPTCIPIGAQKLYRECNAAADDCATFLESERASFEASGYTSAYPSTSNKVLGYAYPNVDTDGDGLVDGMEYVIGTRPDLADSNGDGTSDSLYFPQAGVPSGDPCLGSGAVNCPANYIFKDGFQ